MNKLCPFKWFVLQNFPFIEEDFDAITNYQLLCKVVEYLNKTIEKTNELGTQVEALTNWFNNLDVQDEINNKLDEMAESGELQEIISEYLNSQVVFGFDTVSDMIQSDNLINGSYAKTLGYYSKNDDGTSLYKIRTVTNDDVVDGGSIIAMENESLVAELIVNNTINVKQFGIHEDGLNDDTVQLNKLIEYATSKQIDIKGNYQPILLKGTLKLKYNTKISNCYFKSSSDGSYTNGFLILVNSNDGLSWVQSYPDSTKGYMNNCRFINITENYEIIKNGLHAIGNLSNNKFSNLYFDGFDISFKTLGSYYIDMVMLEHIEISHKNGTNYAIDLGYIGDCTYVNDLHNHDRLVDSPNILKYSGGHNGSVLENLILNGNALFEYGNLTLNNIHIEDSDNVLTFNNCTATVNNLNIVRFDSVPIVINGVSHIILNNVLVAYNLGNRSYSDINDNDITIDSNRSTLTINNCYKKITTSGNIEAFNMSDIKTSRDDQPYSKVVKEYSRNGIDANANISYINQWTQWNLGGDSAKWYEETGTYYYNIIQMADFKRMLTIYAARGEYNKELTNNSTGVYFNSEALKFRVYRGISTGSYNKYVDISNESTILVDSGFNISGYNWKDRTAGGIDSFNTCRGVVKYNGENIECILSELPTVGEWKQGDVVHVYDNNTITTYVCVEDGTPGTWVTSSPS